MRLRQISRCRDNSSTSPLAGHARAPRRPVAARAGLSRRPWAGLRRRCDAGGEACPGSVVSDEIRRDRRGDTPVSPSAGRAADRRRTLGSHCSPSPAGPQVAPDRCRDRPVPAPVTIHCGRGTALCSTGRRPRRRSSARPTSPPRAPRRRSGPGGGHRAARPTPALPPHRGRRLLTHLRHRPPSPSILARMSPGVFAGTTAVNAGPSSRAKRAPATATAPLVAATTGVSALMAPSAIASQNMARTRRYFMLPVGSADSSLT